jgi:hypothetical protein
MNETTKGAIVPVWCVAGKPAKAQIQFDSVRNMYGDGPDMIRDWFLRGRSAGNPFEGFIFTWIAFNGWAERATGLERDSDWIQTLAVSNRFKEDFAELLDWNPVARKAVRRLMNDAPVFKSSWLRKKRRELGLPDTEPRGSRSNQVDFWMSVPGVEHNCRPSCAGRHRHGDGKLPFDWAHTLHAVYQVRCNLFHGEKGRNNALDVRFTDDGRHILSAMIDGTDLFGLDSFASG